MMRSVSRSLKSVLGLRAAALLGAVVSGTGCAQSVGDIDRTQPDLISKDHFDGQWFIRETVVDVPSTSPTSMVGDQGTIEEVVWDIQQDWLVGYRSYEQIPGLDGTAESALANPSQQPVRAGQGNGRNEELYKGNPVVAYRISGHVDVQRGYNARTGEQTNVISENTADRPWYERSFMRVDWSNNEVDSFLTTPGAFMPIFGVSSSAASFIPQNEGGADAFRMELDEEGRAKYIDFTVRRFVTPSVAGCISMMNSGLGDCAGDEIKIRTSLLKVDVEREQEYVPMVYDDRRQGEFGYFRVERPTYDRRLGNTFTGLIQLAGRHDVWETSRDGSGEPLPYTARTLKPITYVLSENYPQEMLPVTGEIIEEYDSTFKKVIAASRSQDVAQLEADLLNDTGESCLFCLDTNEDNSARNGDIRHNFIYWVNDLQAAGPLGFGPSSLNPETGRTISASAYVYGAGVDRYAELAKEIVELMIPEAEGGLSEEELTSGAYFRDAVRGELNPIDPRKSQRFGNLTGDAFAREVLGESSFAKLAEITTGGVDRLAPAIPGFDQARLSQIVGTKLEPLMIPEEWARREERGEPSYLKERSALIASRAQAMGQAVPNQGPLGHLSVTNWFGADALKDLQELEDLASKRSLWLANFDDPAIAGLAREVRDSGLADDDLFQFLRERVFKAVMLHELGHTVGLRHNFAGSADALNFQDEYWPERVKSIEPVAPYIQRTVPSVDALLRSNCAIQGPLLAAVGGTLAGTDTTAACEEQRNGKMAEVQYSSIMDYGGRFNADFHGLGHYDVAALASGYADLVEVFDEEAMTGMAQGGQALSVNVREAALRANQVRNPVLNQGLDNAMAFQGGMGMSLGHYSNYPALFGGYQNLAKRRFMPRAEYLNSLTTTNDLPAVDRAQSPVKVPYLSCYDEFVDSVETCHRWDQGADNYEIVANNLTSYREYYVFNNFQRDRVGFDPFNVYQRTASRYFLPLTNMYQHWLWGRAVTGLTPAGTPRGELGLLATREGLNRLMNTMSTPEYGAHVYDTVAGEYVPAGDTCPADQADVFVPDTTIVGQPLTPMPSCVDVPRGVGRSYFSQYDSSGYDVFRRILESGHFYDQMAALVALQQSNASVVGIGSDVNADSRTFRIPYNLVFENELQTIFSSIYTENDPGYAMHVMRPAASRAEVVPRSVFMQMTPAALASLPVIAPGRTYTTRVQALVAGMSLMDGSLNATFAKQGQISLAGSGEQRTAPAEFDLVESTDPTTGRVFVAYRKSDGTGGPWYAADLLDVANEVVSNADATEADIANIFGDVELVRFAFNIFGE
jgi:uncharacterized protein DUF4953